MFGGSSAEASTGALSDHRRRERRATLEHRIATADDIEAFYGDQSRGTMRAVCVTLDGVVAGVAGVVREREFGKFFVEYSDDLRPHLRSVTVMRALKRSIDFVERYRGPVLAVAAHGEGAYMLMRLGFTHGTGSYWIWLR